MKKSLFKKIEKQTYLLYFKDGIFELLFGSIFIIYGINTWFDMQGIVNSFFMRILIVPVSFILSGIKIYLSQTRLGNVSFLPQRRKKLKLMIIIAVSAQLIALVFYLLAVYGKLGTSEKNNIIGLLIEFTFFVVLFFALTWFSGYLTFLYAGLVYAFTTPLLLMLNPEYHHSLLRIGLMVAAGLIFCFFGIHRLIRFIKEFPRQNKNG